jgi:hypothetical protein
VARAERARLLNGLRPKRRNKNVGGILIDNKAQANAAPPQYGFREALLASQRISRCVDDIINDDKRLDFSKPFLPESRFRYAQQRRSDCRRTRLSEKSEVRSDKYLLIAIIYYFSPNLRFEQRDFFW